MKENGTSLLSLQSIIAPSKEVLSSLNQPQQKQQNEESKIIEPTKEILSSLNQPQQKQQNEDSSQNEEDIFSYLMKIDPESNDLLSIINNLNYFEFKLKSLKNISLVLTNDILLLFQKLQDKKNIPLSLSLSRIYLDILSNESLYKNYLSFNNNYYNIIEKVTYLLYLIDECCSLIEQLNGFVFDPILFQFKNKLLELIKCIYFNCSNKMKNEEDKLDKLKELLDTLPSKYYSNSYLELNKDNNLYDVFKSQSSDKITSFEDKYLDLNNYYEQFEVFKKFVEKNSDSIDNKENDNNNEIINVKNKNDNSDFYYNYALLLLKFCKYHHYIFLDREETEEEKKENGDYGDEDNDNARVVFLLDKFKLINPNYQNLHFTHENQNVQNVQMILNNKQFYSILDSKEYETLIKKQVNYYLNHTKNFENHPEIKPLRDQMKYYLGTLNSNSFVPLYLKEFNKIIFSDNFTPSFLMNVPAGKSNKIYLETKYNEQILVFIEFYLEDKSKDINFEVKKYDYKNNIFKQIYYEERIGETFKFYVFCNGYSLYEIIFNNEYSWFNSKNINYRISLLKFCIKPKNLIESEFYCNLNGKNMLFNCEEIVQRISNKEKEKENEKIINIPVIMYMNNLRIVSIDKNKDGQDELNFKEIDEKDQKYIPKHLFDYSLINYLTKLDIDQNQKIVISIFSQNRDDLLKIKNIEDKIKKEKNEMSLQFLQKIGFIPTAELGDFKVEYQLYDLCEQILIYHLFFCKHQKIPFGKNIVLLKLDKLVINYAIYNEGKITNNIGEGIDNQKCENKEEYILNLIKKLNEKYGGINLVLGYIDYKDEEKKTELMEMFENIQKYCTEQLEPKVPLTIYKENAIDINTFKYINLFYND